MSIIACSIADCEGVTGVPGTARGYCSKHYNRFIRHGDPLSLPEKHRFIACTVPSCEKPHYARGLCSAHITNLSRHGEVSPRKRGEIRDGKKICSTCSLDLLIEEYSKRGNLTQSKCKKCEREYRMARYYEKHQESKEAARLASRNYAESRRDAAKRYRALKKSQHVEDVESLKVFERDQWTCGICNQVIPMQDKWPDPQSASIDHIVPLSLGGAHSYQNIQAAHLVCNMRKGDAMP